MLTPESLLLRLVLSKARLLERIRDASPSSIKMNKIYIDFTLSAPLVHVIGSGTVGPRASKLARICLQSTMHHLCA